jgi:hypothetical protein
MLRILVLLPWMFALTTGDVVKLHVPQVTLRHNTEATIRIRISVKEGFHIQSNKPSMEQFIPTVVTLAVPSELTLFPPVFPSAKKFSLEGTNDAIDVYDGDFDVVIPVQCGNLASGTYYFQGTVRYQSCDARRCYFPEEITFSVRAVVK